MQLHEQYRPHTWSEVVGQDKVLAKIDRLRKRGLAGRAYWLSGQSGVGKTTIARLIAAEIADPYAIEEIDGGECSVPYLRDVAERTRTRPLGQRHGWALIVNESHGLRADVIRKLLVMLDDEHLPPYVTWCLTTTCDGQDSLFEDQIDAHPLLSRCQILQLARRDLAKRQETLGIIVCARRQVVGLVMAPRLASGYVGDRVLAIIGCVHLD